MPFVSELLGRPVRDAAGRIVGKLTDIIVPGEVDYPTVRAVCLTTSDGATRLVPWSALRVSGDDQISLAQPLEETPEYQPAEQDLFLARQVLDRQIIDINGTRVVRVNDLQLTRTNGSLRLVSVDVSTPGLLRRLGLERPLSRLGLRLPPRVIAWQDINAVESGPSGVKLKVPREDLARLHPADIAEIVSQLDQYHGGEVLRSLDAEKAAETLGEFAPDLQVAMLEALDNEQAADILEEMDPDDAADVLGDMRAERAEAILAAMDAEEARDVRELLGYPENTAGGIMTNEFVTVPPDVTVAEAIELVRRQAAEVGDLFYIYVTGPDDRLLGVLSLKELILADPSARVWDVMHHDLVTVDVRRPQEEVARLIAKYNLLALPVVDEERRLLGIVTVDDAIDIILPVAWKKRLPRIFH